MKKTMNFRDRTLTLYPGCGPGVIYLHSGGEEFIPPAHLPCALVIIGGMDWNRELSPWPAPKVFRQGGDFAGEGEAYLSLLTGELIPAAESAWALSPVFRGIAGYSLAGLFALWSLLRTDIFHRAASVSGSLWFDGFLDYLEQTPFAGQPDRIYLSLGDREKHTRNARMAAVESCTLRAAELCRQRGIAARLAFHPGGHFDQPAQRLGQGIQFLAERSPS